MLNVQIFESALAGAWLMLSLDVDCPQRKGKAIKKARHAMQRASPSETRDALANYLPADLLEDVSRAVKWRNTLAHAFLRERLRDEPAAGFKDGTDKALEDLRVLFEETADALVNLIRPRLTAVMLRIEEAGDVVSAEDWAIATEIAREIHDGSAYEPPDLP